MGKPAVYQGILKDARKNMRFLDIAYQAPVMYNGKLYKSAGHAIYHEVLHIRPEQTPSKHLSDRAKRNLMANIESIFGNNSIYYPTTEEAKKIEEILTCKFTQHNGLKRRLIDTINFNFKVRTFPENLNIFFDKLRLVLQEKETLENTPYPHLLITTAENLMSRYQKYDKIYIATRRIPVYTNKQYTPKKDIVAAGIWAPELAEDEESFKLSNLLDDADKLSHDTFNMMIAPMMINKLVKNEKARETLNQIVKDIRDGKNVAVVGYRLEEMVDTRSVIAGVFRSVTDLPVICDVRSADYYAKLYGKEFAVKKDAYTGIQKKAERDAKKK